MLILAILCHRTRSKHTTVCYNCGNNKTSLSTDASTDWVEHKGFNPCSGFYHGSGWASED